MRFVLIGKVTCFISGRDLRRLNVPRVLHGRGGDTEQMEQDLLLPENHQVVVVVVVVVIVVVVIVVVVIVVVVHLDHLMIR